MDTIKKDPHQFFLSSKVARRIFMLFLLCAILPLLTITAVSWTFVGRQLQNEARDRLQQQCKNKGFLIYERLLTLENELKTISRAYQQDRLGNLERNPYDPFTREGSGWRRVFLKTPRGLTVPLLDYINGLEPVQLDEKSLPESDQTLLSISHSDDISPSIYLLRNIDPESPSKGIIAGEINPLYLWGIGVSGSLPPEIEFSVVMSRKKILISSIADYLISAELVEAQKRSAFAGYFENHQNGSTYVNSYWSLFLKHRFSSPDWTIIFSQSKSSIMEPVNSFMFIFFMLVLLTFWIILLLSSRAIRKRTVPIETLKAGAMKIK